MLKSKVLPVGEGGAVDEAAVHLEVGEDGEFGGQRGVDEGGLEDFDGGVAGGHGGESFFAGVGRGAGREVLADEEGDLGFEATVAPAGAGEGAAGGRDPGAGMGAKTGVASGVAAPIFQPPMGPKASAMASWTK